MSADNWTTCPCCKQAADAKKKAKEEEARESYGKVSAEDYFYLLAAATRPVGDRETLREDYAIGVTDEFEFYVHYKCTCDECGFSFKFDHERKAQP